MKTQNLLLLMAIAISVIGCTNPKKVLVNDENAKENVDKIKTELDSTTAFKFEDAYKKLKTSPGGIEAFGNYTTACIRNSQKFIEITKYIENAKSLFDDAEKSLGYNEKLYLFGIDIHKYLLDINRLPSNFFL